MTVEQGHWLLEQPIAHRGLHDIANGIPENTLAAFQAAVDAGHPIELDVCLSADDQILVYHDDNLKRLTGLDCRAGDTPVSVLKTLRVAGTYETIPLLDECLELVSGKTPLLIEVKNRGKVGDLTPRLAHRLKSYSGDVAVMAFSPFVVDWFRENSPNILRGQLSGTFEGENFGALKNWALRTMVANLKTRPNFVAVDKTRITAISTRFWRHLTGLPTLAWTTETQLDYEAIRQYCDNVIFDGQPPKTA